MYKRQILNCAECEPLIKVDRQLMVDYINEILSGMQMMVEAMGAKEGIIAVKKSYTASIEAVKSNIGNYRNLRLHILPDIYPAGDEVVLIYETTGRIVPQGKIPILVGCVVCNVETVLNIYQKVTGDENVVNKFVTVAGLVKKPVTVKVPVGVTVKELIDMAGGVSTEEYVPLMGGPMTGRICGLNDVVTKTTKALLILPPNCLPIRKRQTSPQMDIRNAMSCLLYTSMKSTGECLGIARTFNEALYKAFLGAGINLPKYKNMIITVRDEDKKDIIDVARRFEKIGYRIFATLGTAKVLQEADVYKRQLWLLRCQDDKREQV